HRHIVSLWVTAYEVLHSSQHRKQNRACRAATRTAHLTLESIEAELLFRIVARFQYPVRIDRQHVSELQVNAAPHERRSRKSAQKRSAIRKHFKNTVFTQQQRWR